MARFMRSYGKVKFGSGKPFFTNAEEAFSLASKRNPTDFTPVTKNTTDFSTPAKNTTDFTPVTKNTSDWTDP